MVHGSWFIVRSGIAFLFFLLLTTYYIPFDFAQGWLPIVHAADLGEPPAGPKQIEETFSSVISVSVGLIFVALVFVLIWGGIRYLTSGGEPKSIQAAALTITWAGLGVLFLVIAWLILLLIESFTGVRVTVFCINPQGCT